VEMALQPSAMGPVQLAEQVESCAEEEEEEEEEEEQQQQQEEEEEEAVDTSKSCHFKFSHRR
jgi:hypothetical protein